MSRNDKIICVGAILVIVFSFWWCIHLLLKTPFVNQVKTGTATIQSGIPATEKALIDQKGN